MEWAVKGNSAKLSAWHIFGACYNQNQVWSYFHNQRADETSNLKKAHREGCRWWKHPADISGEDQLGAVLNRIRWFRYRQNERLNCFFSKAADRFAVRKWDSASRVEPRSIYRMIVPCQMSEDVWQGIFVFIGNTEKFIPWNQKRSGRMRYGKLITSKEKGAKPWGLH